jgi:hypothetical protein
MARHRSPPQAAASPDRPAVAVPSTWADWWRQFQGLQVRAGSDMLGVCNRSFAAMASSRDPRAFTAAVQAAMGDWVAYVETVGHRWQELAKAVPPDAMAASGWRLKPGVPAVPDSSVQPGKLDPVEQSRLAFEYLLRPWMPAPDLDHTDEFVA